MSPPIHIRFNESLSWRAGKAIPVTELLRRLQSLAAELKSIEQETAALESIKPAAQDLASQNLLTHKDKGVRAWTASCLVEVLRLFAPNAPYSSAQLKDIFTLFISYIIPSLADPTSSYNPQHQHVLQSLASVKSIILVSDLPSSQALIVRLFSTCFDTLSGPHEDLSKQVEYNMTGMLQCMIEEVPSLPSETIDITLAQFLRADPSLLGVTKNKRGDALSEGTNSQSTLSLKQLPASYNLAKNLCNTSEDRMIRYVSQYFSTLIAESHSFGSGSASKIKSRKRDDAETDEEDAQNVSEDDLKNLNKAHRLLRELWRAAPAVLQNVIPQIEAELAFENIQLRMLATEAVGDMIAGVGAGGRPTRMPLDPALYPYKTLEDQDSDSLGDLTPPQSFLQSHSSAFRSFMGRRNDKSPLIRALWTECIGNILTSSSVVRELNSQVEIELLQGISHMLVDGEEKVRIAAVGSVNHLNLNYIVHKAGELGDIHQEGSLLRNLADRVKDRKQNIRRDATTLLARLWGVAAGEMLVGNEKVNSLLAPIPSRIFDAYYINDPEINGLIYDVLFESLVPLGFPILKKKGTKVANGSSKGAAETDIAENDADTIRTERILVLLKDLDPRAKAVFLALLSKPSQSSNYMMAFLKRCEDYNGGVMDKNEAEIKKHLVGLIEYLTRDLPDSSKATDELWRFAKLHDRRSYGLIRFCMAPDSDYKRVYKSIKELHRRLETNQNATTSMLNTVSSITLRVSNLFLNKSHIRPIIKIAHTDNHTLASAAQDLLKLISAKNAGVFKTHSEELCRSLEAQAPTATRSNDASALDTLKASSIFARRFPDDIPKDRKFHQAMMNFVLFGSPPETAKYAVSIIATASDKKEMHTRDILEKCLKGFEYGAPHFVTRLAALSQLMLLASPALPDEGVDAVVDVAINHILLRSCGTNEVANKKHETNPSAESLNDMDLQAKLWALRILTNRLRAYDDPAAIIEIATPVLQLLHSLIIKDGELSKTAHQVASTPVAHRVRLRLEAGLLLLKLCAKKEKGFDALVTPKSFNRLILLAQDPETEVRTAFVSKIKKYLGQERLSIRHYVPVFLLAFEPERKLRADSITWLKARARTLTLRYPDRHVMETCLARLLSALAHHPDFGTDEQDLTEFVQYIIFYIKAVITEKNISLAYQIAQRVKGVRDAIEQRTSKVSKETYETPNKSSLSSVIEESRPLYTLSDLAQLVLRSFADVQNWSMQTLSAKLILPSGLFKALPSHQIAQDIAEKSYVPDEMDDLVDDLVRSNLKKGVSKENRAKKRKSDDPYGGGALKKRAITSTTSSGPKTRTNAKSQKPGKVQSRPRWSSPANDLRSDPENTSVNSRGNPMSSVPDPSSSAVRRKSSRSAANNRKSYADTRDSDDDEDMRLWNEQPSYHGTQRDAEAAFDSKRSESDERLKGEDDESSEMGTVDQDTLANANSRSKKKKAKAGPQAQLAMALTPSPAESEKENTPVPPSAGSQTTVVVRGGRLKRPGMLGKKRQESATKDLENVATKKGGRLTRNGARA